MSNSVLLSCQQLLSATRMIRLEIDNRFRPLLGLNTPEPLSATSVVLATATNHRNSGSNTTAGVRTKTALQRKCFSRIPIRLNMFTLPHLIPDCETSMGSSTCNPLRSCSENNSYTQRENEDATTANTQASERQRKTSCVSQWPKKRSMDCDQAQQ